MDELDLSTAFFMDASCDDVHKTKDELEPSCFSRPLYKGAPATITEYMANRLLFQYSVKHSLTQKALEELLHLIAVLLPADAELPKSVSHLRKFFLEIHADQNPVMVKYCSTCDLLYAGDEKQCECECGGYSQFVTVPIGQQLKARLEGKTSTIV